MAHYGVKTGLEGLNQQRIDGNEYREPPREEWTVMKFPYEAAEHPPLPSQDEIHRAMKENMISSWVSDFDVCRLENIVVKMGPSNRLFAVRLPNPLLSS
jgi:hypothetical protein